MNLVPLFRSLSHHGRRTRFASIGDRPFAALATTRPLFEQRVMKVPTMGDSITEGTIVEWTAQVGQAVKADDVVALVETDKVTVEIKAEIDGVIVQQFGAVDDTVEVGASLYEIDTEAKASVQVSETAPKNDKAAPPKVEAPAASPQPSQSVSSAPSNERVPSIRFLGKDGWAALKAGKDPLSTGASSATETSVITTNIAPTFGRPAFTEEEMEALILGGASIAPRMVAGSGGAKFK